MRHLFKFFIVDAHGDVMCSSRYYRRVASTVRPGERIFRVDYIVYHPGDLPADDMPALGYSWRVAQVHGPRLGGPANPRRRSLNDSRRVRLFSSPTDERTLAIDLLALSENERIAK